MRFGSVIPTLNQIPDDRSHIIVRTLPMYTGNVPRLPALLPTPDVGRNIDAPLLKPKLADLRVICGF